MNSYIKRLGLILFFSCLILLVVGLGMRHWLIDWPGVLVLLVISTIVSLRFLQHQRISKNPELKRVEWLMTEIVLIALVGLSILFLAGLKSFSIPYLWAMSFELNYTSSIGLYVLTFIVGLYFFWQILDRLGAGIEQQDKKMADGGASQAKLIVEILLVILAILSFISLTETTNLSMGWLWRFELRLAEPAQKLVYISFLALTGIYTVAYRGSLTLTNISKGSYSRRLLAKFKQVSFVGWMIQRQHWYWVGVAGVMAVTVLIKLPFLHLSFTGMHTLKYSSYVEPAKYMAEVNSPFVYRLTYLADPITKNDGFQNKFSHIPVIEWGLFGFYELTPFLSLEVSTRLFMVLLSVVTMVVMSFVFRQWLPLSTALVALLLAGLNPVINLLGYLTAYEAVALLCYFLSVFFMGKYIDRPNPTFAIVAGIIGGMGVATRLSMAVWLVPSVMLLLILQKKLKLSEKVLGLIMYGLGGLVAYGWFYTSISKAIERQLWILADGLVFLLVVLGLILGLKKLYPVMERQLALAAWRSWLVLMAVGVAGLSLLAIFSNNVSTYLIYMRDFMTDTRLIFNATMYKYMLWEQFRVYATGMGLLLGGIGIVVSFLAKYSKMKVWLISIIVPALLYWVIASKAMFFHNYYTGIIMIAIAVLAAIAWTGVYQLFSRVTKPLWILVLVLVGVQSVITTTGWLSKEREGFFEAAEYLKSNTTVDEVYFDDLSVQALSIATDRQRVYSVRSLSPDDLKEAGGLKNLMDKHGIAYLIRVRPVPSYDKFMHLYRYERPPGTGGDRGDYIDLMIHGSHPNIVTSRVRDDFAESFNIEDKFTLEKIIGDYYFFTFNN